MVELMSEIKIMVKSNIAPESNSSKYSSYFPLCSSAELDDVEMEIDEDSKDAIVRILNNFISLL